MRANLAGRWTPPYLQRARQTRSRGVLGWLVLSVLVLACARAHAEAPPRFDIELRAPHRCADPAQFSALLRARLAADAMRDSLPVRFVLRLTERADGRVAATMTLMRGSSVIRRELEAGSCHEAIDALALVAALILDPTPTDSPPRAPGAQGAPAPRARPATSDVGRDAKPAAGSVETSADAGTTAESPSPAPPPAPQHEPTPPASSATSRAPVDPASADRAELPIALPPRLRIETAAGARGRVSFKLTLFTGPLLVTGVTPAVRPGATFGLSLGLQRERLELTLELDARGILPHRTRDAQGMALFTLWAGAAKLCGLGLFSQGRLGLSGCAVAELGALVASGSATDAPADSHTLWTALGPALRFELRAKGPYWVRLGAELPLPVLRKRYTLGETTVFSVPHVTFRGELVLGVRFL